MFLIFLGQRGCVRNKSPHSLHPKTAILSTLSPLVHHNPLKISKSSGSNPDIFHSISHVYSPQFHIATLVSLHSSSHFSRYTSGNQDNKGDIQLKVVRHIYYCCQGHSTPCAPRPQLDSTQAGVETRLGYPCQTSTVHRMRKGNCRSNYR